MSKLINALHMTINTEDDLVGEGEADLTKIDDPVSVRYAGGIAKGLTSAKQVSGGKQTCLSGLSYEGVAHYLCRSHIWLP